MKNNKILLQKVLSTMFVAVVSLIAYWIFDYNIKSIIITGDGLILERVNYAPIAIHLFFTLYLLFMFFYFHKAIWEKTNRYLQPHVNRLNTDYILPFVALFDRSKDPSGSICKSTKTILIILFVFIVASLQTYTIWDFFREEVDENAIFHFSIGFLGGDLNPGWFGYGGLGMYLLYFVYLIFAIPPLILGKFASIEEYAMQMFYNDYFVLVARYVFAIAGIIAVLVYGKLANRANVPRVLILLFLIVSLTSKDAIFFANNLRTDQLVMFFTALSVFFAANSHNKRNLYFLAIAVAGAIASKISALPLIVILGIYTLYRLYDKTINWKSFSLLGVVFISFLFVFQPYTDIWSRVMSIFKVGTKGYQAQQANIYWDYYSSYSERFGEILGYFVEYCTVPVLLSLTLLVFSRKYIKYVIPALLALVLLVLPYYKASALKYYWFLPAYNVVRFLALIGIAGFIYEVSRLSPIIMKEKYAKYVKPGLTGVFVVFGFIGIVLPALNNYLQQFKWEPTNHYLAQKYIEKNLLENELVVLDGHRTQYMPKVYDVNNFTDSKRISRSFMHNRNSNEFLNRVFYNYLRDYYYDKIGVDAVKGVSQLNLGFRKYRNIDYEEYLQGKYFVTSPFIYEAHMQNPNRNSRHFGLYSFVLSNPMHKAFYAGISHPIEIYYIPERPEEYAEADGMCFMNKWAEVNVAKAGLLTEDITISMTIRLNNFPTTWTTLVNKFESDFQNEFNLRIRDSQTGMWYYGVGDHAIIRSWVPNDEISLHKWTTITATRSMSGERMDLYIDGRLVAARGISADLPAIQTNAPIQIMGDSRRSINGRLADLIIFNKALSPLEVRQKKRKIHNNVPVSNIVGYWKFEDNDEKAVKDLSGNDRHIIINNR